MGKEERLERMEPSFEGNPEALKVEEMQERPAKRQAKGMTGRLEEIAESEGKEELLSIKVSQKPTSPTSSTKLVRGRR